MRIRDRLKSHFPFLLLAAPLAGFLIMAFIGSPGTADFTFVNQGEVSSLDPAVSTAIPEGRIITAVFEGLVTLHPETLEPVPGAAESWEVSKDGLTYTFHIRPGLRWSDGTKLTARDFVYSWTRFLAPETAAPYAYLLWNVRGGKECSQGRLSSPEELGLSATDDLTLEVRLESPCPYFLNLLTFYSLSPVNGACLARHGPGRWLKPENIVSNGPFRIRERRLKDRIRLERNPFYREREKVSLLTIDALAVDSPVTAFNLYLTGDVDWINTVPSIAIPFVMDRPDFSISLNLGTNFLRLNVTAGPLDNADVRRAIHLGIDKREIVDHVLKGGQVPATSFVPPGIPGYTPPNREFYNPKRAREHLARAGFPDGRGFPELSLLYSMGEVNRDLAEVIALQLKRNLNIRIHPAGQERKVYFLSQRTLDYDLCLCSWLGDYLDPSTFLDVFASTSGNNRTGWGRGDYDGALLAASAELDPQKRGLLLRRAEEILLDDLPIAPLYFRTTTNMINRKWEGYYDNLLDVHPLKHLRKRRGH